MKCSVFFITFIIANLEIIYEIRKLGGSFLQLINQIRSCVELVDVFDVQFEERRFRFHHVANAFRLTARGQTSLCE
jgi:hypothetical protein